MRQERIGQCPSHRDDFGDSEVSVQHLDNEFRMHCFSRIDHHAEVSQWVGHRLAQSLWKFLVERPSVIPRIEQILIPVRSDVIETR